MQWLNDLNITVTYPIYQTNDVLKKINIFSSKYFSSFLNIWISLRLWLCNTNNHKKTPPNPKQQYRFNVHNKKNCMFLKSYLWGYINSFQRKYSFCRQWTPQIYQRWVLAHTQTAADNDISCEVHTDSSGCPVILWSASFTNIRGRFT